MEQRSHMDPEHGRKTGAAALVDAPRDDVEHCGAGHGQDRERCEREDRQRSGVDDQVASSQTSRRPSSVRNGSTRRTRAPTVPARHDAARRERREGQEGCDVVRFACDFQGKPAPPSRGGEPHGDGALAELLVVTGEGTDDEDHDAAPEHPCSGAPRGLPDLTNISRELTLGCSSAYGLRLRPTTIALDTLESRRRRYCLAGAWPDTFCGDGGGGNWVGLFRPASSARRRTSRRRARGTAALAHQLQPVGVGEVDLRANNCRWASSTSR